MNTGLATCDDGHESVCFSRSTNCPVCVLKSEIREQDQELSRLLKLVDDQKDEIENLKIKYAE